MSLYVREGGRGHGKMLSDHREQHALAAGCERMRVSCWRTNEQAKGFVFSRGFEGIGSGYREPKTQVMVDHYERGL